MLHSQGGAKVATQALIRWEALRIEPDTSLPGVRVVRVLEGLRERRGTPAAIQVDNGTEFTSRVVAQWAYQNQVALHFIERGKSPRRTRHQELQREVPR